jgi:hypothetical protein
MCVSRFLRKKKEKIPTTKKQGKGQLKYKKLHATCNYIKFLKGNNGQLTPHTAFNTFPLHTACSAKGKKEIKKRHRNIQVREIDNTTYQRTSSADVNKLNLPLTKSK